MSFAGYKSSSGYRPVWYLAFATASMAGHRPPGVFRFNDWWADRRMFGSSDFPCRLAYARYWDWPLPIRFYIFFNLLKHWGRGRRMGPEIYDLGIF